MEWWSIWNKIKNWDRIICTKRHTLFKNTYILNIICRVIKFSFHVLRWKKTFKRFLIKGFCKKPTKDLKRSCIIEVYIYVLHLSGLYSSVGYTAVIYRIFYIVRFCWHPGLIPSIGLYNHPFIFIQNCAFCILLKISSFNARFLFKLKAFMKTYVLKWKKTTVTITKCNHALFEDKNHLLCVTGDRCHISNHDQIDCIQ